MIASSSLESLEFLFQKRSQASNQISPHSPFAVASAVKGNAGFQSQTAPNQTLKKRKILLNYNSCLRLWNPTEMALEIAKLKQEGFEVAFILKGKNEGDIFESLIEDKAEGDKKYDYKFKDKNGEDKSIFELSDQFIKENFSKLDHETSINKLNLTRDESIILSYEQFDQVDKIFKQEYWADKERVSKNSSLSYSFFKGAVIEYPLYKIVVGSFGDEDPLQETNDKLIKLLTHEDFNIEDQDTLIALDKNLCKLKGYYYNIENLFSDIRFYKTKDEKTLKVFFDKNIFDNSGKDQSATKLTISKIKKNILGELWFKCSNFNDVVERAKTLDEFRDKSPDQIASSLFPNQENSFAIYLKFNPVFPFDILERYQGENALNIFEARNQDQTFLNETSIINIIAQQQINQTSFGNKIQVNFVLLDNDGQGNFIEFEFQLLQKTHNLKSTLSTFIDIFSNPQINQHFNLTEQFGDAIIADLSGKELQGFFDSSNSNSASNFFDQLNNNQKTQFLDLLKKKIKNAEASTIKNTEKVSILLTLQHFLDQPSILNFAKLLLTEGLNNNTSGDFNFEYHNLTPAFQDLLLEMHEEKKLDLDKIKLLGESKLFAKFDKTQLRLNPFLSITSLDSYLKNIEFCLEVAIDFDSTKISSQGSAESPLQITLFDLNEESLKIIKEKITSGELDPSKILSVDVLGIERDQDQDQDQNQKSDDEKTKSLTDFLELFPNLKLAKIDIKAIESKNELPNRLKVFSNTIVYIHDSSNESAERILNENSSQTIISPPSPFTATKIGDPIFIGNVNSSGASTQDSPAKFSMKETGEIIQRPASTKALQIRTTSEKLNPHFAKLEDNLFVDIDEYQAISSEESASIENFSQQDFEAKKTELGSTPSERETICSFSRNLQANAKNILPSISPDNKIIGYYTGPDSAKVEFLKDESGFYYAKPTMQCQIHYLIEGQELELQTPNQNLNDLPENVKKIITEYVGDNPANFPLSVKHDQYQLPDFSTKKQFLDDLFNLKNKGSCRHRVASLADKFENNGLECGKDFRIIGIDGNHVLMEVKKQNSDEWITLNLGGEEGILEKASEPPLVLAPVNPLPIKLSAPETPSRTSSLGGSDGQSGDQNSRVTRRNFFLIRCMSCLGFGTGAVKPNQKSVQTTLALELVFTTSQAPNQNTEIIADPIRLEELAKIQEKKLQNLKILESALDKLHQIKKVENLENFKENFEQFVTENKSSALLLKTTGGEELKNYLLRMSSSSQNPSRPDDDQSTSTATQHSPALSTSTLSFGAFYASSPQDLTAKKSTLHIGGDNKSVKINTKTPLLSFLENARQHNDKQHVLIIDWSNFDASSQVAFNTMFDKNSRKIDDQEIPDNIKIVCIDSSKQQTTDSSILSRFDGGALDLSSIPKNQFTKLPSETSSRVREINEIEFDGEGLVNWKEKLFGRIIVDGNSIKWEKSDFVKSLEAIAKDGIDSSNPDQTEQKELHINFKNFSLAQQQEMKIFFEQAKALGSIDYHDYKITIPQDLSINFAHKEFEFTEVLKSFKPADSADSLTSKRTESRQLRLNIYKNSLASNQLPADIHLINSHLFDQLLTQPQIEGNQYQEKAGLIKSASTSESKTLKLFLSEDLTPQQFYCLLNQAQEHQVSLELYLAKDFKIPNANLQKFTQEFGLNQKKQDGEVPKKDLPLTTTTKKTTSGIALALTLFVMGASDKDPVLPTKKPPSIFSKLLAGALFVMGASPNRIIITNNIEESLNKTIKAIESANGQSSSARTINLVNAEDILYGNLFGKNQHKIVTKEDGSQHFAFEKIKTAIKTKLDAGETVILKGEFSAELLSLLHPQILDLQKEFSNLHFIIEDKNISKSKPQSSKLSWLDPSLYKVEYSPEVAKKTMEEKTAEGKIIREDYHEIESSIPDDSKTQADDFIKGRKNKLLELLQENPILQIFGHSGVGKSSLLREIAKTSSTQSSDVAVYNELSSLEAWSRDTSEKTKILVIDEFNVDGSTNFTLFRDLANNPKQFPQTIFHDRRSFTLTENHKVVFLGNPPNYGNRFSQKLFEDCQITEWHLQDFPVSYIYEEILAKPIYEGLSAESKTKLSQEDFKEIALDEIKNYKAKNQGDPQTKDILPSETVRELQEKVLKEIVKKISPIESSQVQNANFIETEANQQNIAELKSAIEIRKLQKDGKIPPQFLGTCGVIFEGDSGVGKSVMIEAVLENRGITKIDSLENLAQEIAIEKMSEISPEIKPHYYYKIPASLPIEEIEKNLIKAFELGVIVVFDEMNTRIKEGGLEKTINALLTGQHPQDSKIKPQAGFMLIASVNKATNSGRAPFSPAIIARSFVIKAKSLSEYTQEDFEKIIGNWVENEEGQKEIKETSEVIKKLAETQPEKLKNLRDLQKIIPKVLSELKTQNRELSRATSVL